MDPTVCEASGGFDFNKEPEGEEGASAPSGQEKKPARALDLNSSPAPSSSKSSEKIEGGAGPSRHGGVHEATVPSTAAGLTIENLEEKLDRLFKHEPILEKDRLVSGWNLMTRDARNYLLRYDLCKFLGSTPITKKRVDTLPYGRGLGIPPLPGV